MLTLRPLGGSSISLQEGKTEIVVYPKKAQKDAISLLSTPEEAPADSVISWPGEYDVGGVSIRGIGQKEGQQVSFVLQMDGVRVALPSSPIEEWSQADIERLGDVHVLVLPADNSKYAQTLLDEVDPRVLVIVPGGDGKIHPEILKIAGATGKAAVSEHKIKGLPAEGREVVVLEA